MTDDAYTAIAIIYETEDGPVALTLQVDEWGEPCVFSCKPGENMVAEVVFTPDNHKAFINGNYIIDPMRYC